MVVPSKKASSSRGGALKIRGFAILQCAGHHACGTKIVIDRGSFLNYDARNQGWTVFNALRVFDRCRLSASPATGLVGMRENTFLCDFFGSVGFLPLASQR